MQEEVRRDSDVEGLNNIIYMTGTKPENEMLEEGDGEFWNRFLATIVKLPANIHSEEQREVSDHSIDSHLWVIIHYIFETFMRIG